ncbi:MAG: DUF86 domain-containing protein [Armatimonadota bacterium]|nr:DUF86 domain-containing protein [Armatimonadota bacterium]
MTSKLGLPPEDVAERIEELPARLAELRGLAAVWLFGSWARGEATPVSDVDLAYLPAADGDGADAGLYRVVTRVLGTDEVTLADVRALPATVAWQVVAEGRLLVLRDPDRVARWVEEVLQLAPELFRLGAEGNADFLRGVLMHRHEVDRDRVVELLRAVSADLADLRDKAQMDRERFLASRDAQAVVERRLQTAVEGCLNVGNHVIARKHLGVPRDYTEVFRILGQAGILSPQVAEAMADLARLRNLLVHLYWRVDHARLHESLPQRIRTLESFVEDVSRWLAERGDP